MLGNRIVMMGPEYTKYTEEKSEKVNQKERRGKEGQEWYWPLGFIMT